MSDLCKTEEELLAQIRELQEEVDRYKACRAEWQDAEEKLRAALQQLGVHQEEFRVQSEDLRTVQQELELSRARYRDLYDFSPIGYFTFERSGVIRECNITVSRMLGIERMRLLGRPILNHVVSSSRGILLSHFRKVFAGHASTVELELLAQGGDSFFVQFESIPGGNGGGDVLECGSAVFDISARKQAECALRNSELKYRSLIEHMNEALVLCEGIMDENGGFSGWIIRDVNPAFDQLAGVSRKELIGRNALSLFRDVGGAGALSLQGVAETGRPLRSEAFLPAFGRHFNLSVFSPGGNYVALVLADVTEIKRAEQARQTYLLRLEAEKVKLRAIIDNTPVGILVADKDCRIIMANPIAEKLYSRSSDNREEMVRRMEFQLCRSDGTPFEPRHLPLARSTFLGEVHADVEIMIRWPDGQKRDLLVYTAPIVDDLGRINGAVAAFRDVTELKKAERERRKLLQRVEDYASELSRANEQLKAYAGELLSQKEALRISHDELEKRVEERTAELASANEALQQEIMHRKSAEEDLTVYAAMLEQSNRELQEFAFVASHDLQEPLRKIQIFGSRLKMGYWDVLDDTGRDCLDRMMNGSERLRALIQGLLSYARVTTKTEPFVPVPLSALLEEVVADLGLRIEETGGYVEISDLPVIEADPLQMRQLFQNLVSNAIKFHGDKPPLVRIHGRPLQDEAQPGRRKAQGQWVEITVQDNGIGFDEKYADRIFGLFERLHGRSTYEGTGMGLAICRKIVERHGGTISTRSIPNEGATFIITLPLANPANRTQGRK